MSEEVVNNLRRLKSIKMNAERQSVQRDFLLSQIKADSSLNESGSFTFWSYFNQPLIYKPLAYVMAVLAILIMGSGYTMSAASRSLPGNVFYPVKLSWEKLQVSIVSDEVNKTKKQIEFADRRLSELSALTETTVSPLEKQEQVGRALKYFNNSIRDAKDSLERAVSSEDENGDLLELAQLVNDKSQDFEEVLAGYYPDLPVTVRLVVEREVAEVKFQSLEVLIAKYQRHSQNVSKDMIVDQLQDKLISLGAWASELESDEMKDEALVKLNEIQQLLEADEFSEVLLGINEFMIWQESLNTEEGVVEGEVLGVNEELKIDIATTTTTSTEPIIELVDFDTE